MSRYHTRQREVLIECLTKHTDEPISARQLAHELEGDGISLSAVYRNLSYLEAEGKVRKCTRGGSREVFYQYAGNCGHCLHLSCSRCGRTSHMNAHGADILTRCVERSEDFVLDKGQTVIYGICRECRGKEGV